MSLERLDRLVPEARLPGRNGTKADILKVRIHGKALAVKDYRPRPVWVRLLIGRFLTGRESRGYAAAGPAEGLPRFVGRLGPATLATAWVEAEPLARWASGRERPVPPEPFDRLDRILDSLHGRGVALADLHHRDVLVDDRGGVHVVDLAMSYRFRNRPAFLRPLRRWLFRHACRLDRIAAARMRARFTGGDVEAAVAEAGGDTAGLYRAGRKLKAILPKRSK